MENKKIIVVDGNYSVIDFETEIKLYPLESRKSLDIKVLLEELSKIDGVTEIVLVTPKNYNLVLEDSDKYRVVTSSFEAASTDEIQDDSLVGLKNTLRRLNEVSDYELVLQLGLAPNIEIETLREDSALELLDNKSNINELVIDVFGEDKLFTSFNGLTEEQIASDVSLELELEKSKDVSYDSEESSSNNIMLSNITDNIFRLYDATASYTISPLEDFNESDIRTDIIKDLKHNVSISYATLDDKGSIDKVNIVSLDKNNNPVKTNEIVQYGNPYTMLVTVLHRNDRRIELDSLLAYAHSLDKEAVYSILELPFRHLVLNGCFYSNDGSSQFNFNNYKKDESDGYKTLIDKIANKEMNDCILDFNDSRYWIFKGNDLPEKIFVNEDTGEFYLSEHDIRGTIHVHLEEDESLTLDLSVASDNDKDIDTVIETIIATYPGRKIAFRNLGLFGNLQVRHGFEIDHEKALAIKQLG